MGKTKQIGKKTIKGKKVKSEEEEKVDSEYAQEHSPEDPESP